MSTTIPVPQESHANCNGFFHGPSNPRLEQMLQAWKSGKLWHNSAAPELRENWKSLDDAAAWKRWTDYITNRKTIELVDTAGTKADPTDWALPSGVSPVGDCPLSDVARWRSDFDQLLRKPGNQATATKLEACMAELVHELENSTPTASAALKAVVAGYRLAKLARCVAPAVWWRVLSTLQELAAETQVANAENLQPEPTLVATLLAGELPFVLSVVLPELKPIRTLRPSARKALSESLLAVCDGEGLVEARLLPALPLLFASWTRTRAIGDNFKKGCWSDSAETQYEWLVRQTIRLQRPNGAPMLTTSSLTNWPTGTLDVALELAGDEQDDTAAAAHFGKLLPTIGPDYDADELPEASVESEWSSMALLASGWGKTAARVLVDYSQQQMSIEIESGGKTLLSGGLVNETTLDGKPLEPLDDWEQQCWHSDDDCDFLDLMIELTGGARLERQIFLGKDDAFLVVHDILHGPEGHAGDWQHSMQVPLFTGYKFSGEKETRDGVLLDAKGTPRACVLPLALAEWRVEPRFGELTSTDDSLQLTQQAHGARLSCPLWFDLRTRRASKPRTWRKLTVAASLEVAPSDVAVGYRVQCGDAQWLLYRSLAEPANRTVLGQNTAAEMFVGRFYRTGECDELLAVDPGGE